MIKINLMPGATKRSRRRQASPGASKPKASLSLPSVDKWLLVLIGGWIIGPVVTGWLFLGAKNEITDLGVAIEGARMDSIRYAEMRRMNEVLLARQDSIAQKLAIIQEIDAGRYSWVHIMDEVARALPPYTWLIQVVTRPVDTTLDSPHFQIEGRAGNTLALTAFMEELEASPFIRSIRLVTTDQVKDGEHTIYSFVLDGQFQHPPADMIETVSLFQAREGD
ncbi:MAG: PilN domain-containing protein [Longimicrobiales bacterium]